jgi:deoxyribonuclease-4
MLLGAHLSIAGGLHKALERARALGFATLALFVRNQRQWRSPALTDQAAETFRRTRARLGIGPVVAHGSYLLNLAGDDRVRNPSLEAAGEELDRCGRLGIEYYVFHPGSFGEGSRACGLARLVEALDALVDRCRHAQVKVLLETTSGAGHQVGGTFEELAEVLGRVRRPERFGVCLDTCHVFAAGYDIRTLAAYADTMGRFDRIVGLDRLLAIHLNDSLGRLGSHLDRHTHIGKGKIALAGFANFVNDGRLSAVPMLLETPKGTRKDGKDWDAVNAAALRRLVRKGRPRRQA